MTKDDCTIEEVLASTIYAKLVRSGVSKAIVSQYLADLLQSKYGKDEYAAAELRQRLPTYLTNAIDYVTRASEAEPEHQKSADG